MLHIKRRLSQSVVIEESVTWTITRLDSDGVQITISDGRQQQLRRRGHIDVLAPSGALVTVFLDRISSGEAWLSFQAPRSVSIDRPEYLERLPANPPL